MKTEANEPISASTEIAYYGSEDQWRKEIFHPGLTKREHFAAMAMQGLLASPIDATSERFAEQSVQMADTLIHALNSTTR